MSEFRLKIVGANRVGNKLRRLASFHKERLNPTGKKWAQAKSKQLRQKPYPPKVPNQKYKRTGRLGRSWRAMNPRPGVWTILNKANQGRGEYAHFVVGNKVGDGQAFMHRGRWWKAREIIEEDTPTLTQALSEEINKIINE